MAEVTLTINGRTYGVSCDDGQEQRVMDLGHYVDARMRELAKSGGGANESHMLVLTSLMMADEVFELRDNLAALGDQVEGAESFQEEETLTIQAIEHLADRIDVIADRIQKA